MVFSQNELIIMIGVVSVLLLCITILTILDIKEYLKAKKSVDVLETDFEEEYHEEEKKIEPVQVVYEEKEQEEMVQEIHHNTDDMLFEEMDDEKFDVNVKVNPIIQEVNEEEPKIIEVKEDVELPKISEVKEEVLEPVIETTEKKKLELFEELDELEEKLPNKLDDVTNFEMEQERTAIISLDELLKKTDELYNDNEMVQYNDDNAPISIDEVISRFRQESEPVVKEVKEDVSELPIVMQEIEEDVVLPYSRKETIPFISSVYGIEKENNALEFENTATYEKLDRENYNDFVAKLREMNENK